MLIFFLLKNSIDFIFYKALLNIKFYIIIGFLIKSFFQVF